MTKLKSVRLFFASMKLRLYMVVRSAFRQHLLHGKEEALSAILSIFYILISLA